MNERVLAALPAIGILVGFALYYPVAWLFLESHQEFTYVVESEKREPLQFSSYEMVETEVFDQLKKYNVPRCDIADAANLLPEGVPVLTDGELVLEKRVVTASGRGDPIVKVVGEVPVFSAEYSLECKPELIFATQVDPRTGGVKSIPIIVDVRSKLELVQTDRKVAGYVTKKQIEFEKPFEPSDLAQLATAVGAWIALAALFRSGTDARRQEDA